MTDMINKIDKKQILSEDYYRVFLIDGSDLQLTDLENMFCECVSTKNYISQKYLRIYSCWERALEYLYRASVKNWGDSIQADVVKALSELKTIQKIFLTLVSNNESMQNIFSNHLLPESLYDKIVKTHNLDEIVKIYVENKNRIQSHVCPLVLSCLLDFKRRFSFLSSKYSFEYSDALKAEELENLFVDFLKLNSINDIDQFIKRLESFLNSSCK